MLYLKGELDRDDIWPKVKDYENQRYQFRWEFGLDELPTEAGLIIVRGPRQSGKSTWLELQLLDTLERYGVGTGFLLNGDSIYSHREFEQKLLEVEQMYLKNARVRRLFIDEITQIPDWQRVIKRLVDAGSLKSILIVTTGSNAADLLRASERLPGRKGSLPRTEYIFLPISFREYWYQTRGEIGSLPSDLLWAYIEQLADLLVLKPMMQWSLETKSVLVRRPSKFSFVNMSAAWVFHLGSVPGVTLTHCYPWGLSPVLG